MANEIGMVRADHDTETIVAPATAPGRSALAVLRLSGPRAVTVLQRLRPAGARPLTARRATVTRLMDGAGGVLDEAVATVFPGPNSFTGEDVVELSTHGNPLITRRLLELCFEAGARLARPGEFAQRAFFNGRMDLTQAEAVMDVIGAHTEAALRSAQASAGGALRRRIEGLREALLQSLAHVEAYLDFPDEDITPEGAETLANGLQEQATAVERLLSTAETGRILRHGLRAAIVGRPNVGKSSVLNALVGARRAIVSPIPGTTRDTIEEWIDVEGVPLHVIDTAGLRETADAIEKEGVERSEQAWRDAELVLFVFDRSVPWTRPDAEIEARCDGGRTIRIANKVDQPAENARPADVELSALTGAGLGQLRALIRSRVEQAADLREDGVTVNARHRDCLMRAQGPLAAAIAGLRGGLAGELVSEELRAALNALTEIIGVTSNEEVLDRLFHSFCIGK